MITYHGFRDENGTAHVTANGRKLPLRLDLANHSPTGFEWGYGGSGPAQLALALLAHATGDDKLAVRQHQAFKWRVIGKLHRERDWYSTDAIVRSVSANLDEKRQA